jgi:xanthine dehydrogenase YagS FAD-binding subunit
VHPSNIAPALMVLGGEVRLIGGKRERLSLAELYHMPDKGILDEHNLQSGEVITTIFCRPAAASAFYAVKAKQSFDWPSAFACVALELDGGVIREARVCAGAVAPMPWMLPAVAGALKGVKISDDAAISAAAALATQGSKPMRDNKYKEQLLRVCVKRAVLKAAGRAAPEFSGSVLT